MSKNSESSLTCQFIIKAENNIREDRDVTKVLLKNMMAAIDDHDSKDDPMNFSSMNSTAAKLVETLQRSNEQIVKLASIIKDMEKSKDFAGFSEDENEDLINEINKKYLEGKK